MAKNIYAVFAGNVLEAQSALAKVKECLAFSSSGTFEDLRKILKSSFDSKITTWDPQAPHCLLGVVSTKGDSKLLYAQPVGTSYEVLERTQAVIGAQYLEPELQKKIDAFKPKGLYRPEQFMLLPDDIFPINHDRKEQAIHDAREISRNIIRVFLEIVEDPLEAGVNSPLQTALLLPTGSEHIALYDINVSSIKSPKIARKTARASEVREEHDSSNRAIVELNIRDST